MVELKDRLETAQWILERNLSWIASADLKVGVIVTINIAMLGGLAAVFGWSDASREIQACVLTGFASFMNLAAIATAALAMFPETDGPPKSLLFFGVVSAMESGTYKKQLAGATNEEILADIGAQIHRNAAIAAAKFRWVKAGMVMSFLSVPLWSSAIFNLLVN